MSSRYEVAFKDGSRTLRVVDGGASLAAAERAVTETSGRPRAATTAWIYRLESSGRRVPVTVVRLR